MSAISALVALFVLLVIVTCAQWRAERKQRQGNFKETRAHDD